MGADKGLAIGLIVAIAVAVLLVCYCCRSVIREKKVRVLSSAQEVTARFAPCLWLEVR